MVAFRCYNPSGKPGRGFHAWFDTLPADERAGVSAGLERIQAETRICYVDQGGLFKQLHTKCAGITEIIIDFLIERDDGTKPEKVIMRLLGFETSHTEFVLLNGFRKFGDRQYGRACRTAQIRKKSVVKRGSRARPCTFPQPLRNAGGGVP